MLQILQNKSVTTMSSREISELTGKNHFDVKRDIQNILLQAEIDASKFAVIYKDSQNRNQSEYNLPKRECDLVISGYSVKYRLAIIDRWQELENIHPAQNPMAMLNDPAAMRAMLLGYTEKVLELQPKADALDLISESVNSRCIRDAAKELKWRPSDLTKYLIDEKWIYRQHRDDGSTGKVMAYQHRIDQGLIEHCSVIVESKGQTRIATSVKITGKGFAKLAVIFASVK